MDSAFHFDPEETVEKYADMVYRLCRINSSTIENAEDAFQETFLKLVSSRKSFENEEHLKAWLIRVSISQCRTVYTSSHWGQQESFESREDRMTEAGCEPGSVSDTFTDSDRRMVLESALLSIPPDDRLLIHLFYYEEYPVKEIARILNSNQTLISVRLHRIRNKLKAYFEERGLRYGDV